MLHDVAHTDVQRNAKRDNDLSEEEVARRAAYLRRQRDLLKAKKTAERQAALEQHLRVRPQGGSDQRLIARGGSHNVIVDCPVASHVGCSIVGLPTTGFSCCLLAALHLTRVAAASPS